jgi:hypothetical protein
MGTMLDTIDSTGLRTLMAKIGHRHNTRVSHHVSKHVPKNNNREQHKEQLANIVFVERPF